jgi:hypothetical protein
MTTNMDGPEKQDCRRNAAKRRLRKHAQQYIRLPAGCLYSNYQFWNAAIVLSLPAQARKTVKTLILSKLQGGNGMDATA